MVVTARPSARKAGTRQVWTGMPSSQTVQAPQSPASQPFLTPNTALVADEGPQALARSRRGRKGLAVDREAHAGPILAGEFLRICSAK